MTWNHNLTMIVPASMTADANQLALAWGTGPADANTFGNVWYSADGVTETHSVCNTRAKDVVIDAGTYKLLPDPLPEGCDGEAARRALDALTIWDMTGTPPEGIAAVVDRNPNEVFEAAGLVRLEAV